jgi:acetoin utilization deacetylase AcuC-like enzyme
MKYFPVMENSPLKTEMNINFLQCDDMNTHRFFSLAEKAQLNYLQPLIEFCNNHFQSDEENDGTLFYLGKRLFEQPVRDMQEIRSHIGDNYILKQLDILEMDGKKYKWDFISMKIESVSSWVFQKISENPISGGTMKNVLHSAQCIERLVKTLFGQAPDILSFFGFAFNRPPGHHCNQCIGGFLF